MENSRSKNFTEDEINLLVEVVGEKRDVIECKKTGVVNHKQKSAAWIEIMKKFNALSGRVPRTEKMLKEKWANIKKAAVRNHAADKKKYQGTGGGPKENPVETPTQAIIIDILGERLTGMPSECDGDFTEQVSVTEASCSFVENVEREEMIIDASLIIEGQDDAIPTPQPLRTLESESDWANYTPKMLQSTPSKPLQHDRKARKATGADTNIKWCNLAEKKLELAQFKKLYMEAEEKRKEELHKLTMIHMQEEHDQKIRHREEEHLLKLKKMKNN